MSARDDNSGRPFEAVKAVIGRIELQHEGNITTPYRKNLIICANGGIHSLTTDAFSPTEERLFAMYGTASEQFTREETT